MILCTVADDRCGHKGGKYTKTQQGIYDFFNRYDVGISNFNMWAWEDIQASKHYQTYRHMLDVVSPAHNGRLYKPLLIRDSLDKIEMGDCVIYNDTSPEMWAWLLRLNEFDTSNYDLNIIRELCESNNGILSTHCNWGAHLVGEPGAHTHDHFTSDLCIETMGAEEYRYCIQHASGLIVIKKQPDTIDFVDEWIKYNAMPECSGMGRATPGSQDSVALEITPIDKGGGGKLGHRHDQSVSGILLNRRNGKIIKQQYNSHHLGTSVYLFLNYCQKRMHYDWILSTLEQKKAVLRRSTSATMANDGIEKLTWEEFINKK